MYKLILGLFTCALLAGCNGSSDSSHNQFAANRTQIVMSCPDNMVCGYMKVPKDYAIPSGDMVNIFYGIHKATDPANRIGVLLFNFGGPGASSVAGAARVAAQFVPKEIRERFDIVGMDPRGSGNSAFAQKLRECGMGYGRHKCDAVYAQVAPYMGSNSVVQDMDSLRKMLNEDTLNYIGYSYGTRLGSLYAARFPEHVRAFVLDASMSPTSGNNEDMRLDNTAGYHLIADFRMEHNDDRMNQLATLVNQTAYSPYRYESQDGYSFYKGDINKLLDFIMKDDWNTKALKAPFYKLLDDYKAEPLLKHLNLYSNRNRYLSSEDVKQIEKARSAAMFRAVVCTDESEVLSDYEIADKQQEYIDRSNIYGLKTFEKLSGLCSGWQFSRDSIPNVGESQFKFWQKQILVIGGQYDPKTPYIWAEKMRESLGPDASLITVNNYVKHGFSYQKKEHPCVDNPVTQYLLSPESDIGDRTCDAPGVQVLKMFDVMPESEHPVDEITIGW